MNYRCMYICIYTHIYYNNDNNNNDNNNCIYTIYIYMYNTCMQYGNNTNNNNNNSVVIVVIIIIIIVMVGWRPPTSPCPTPGRTANCSSGGVLGPFLSQVLASLSDQNRIFEAHNMRCACLFIVYIYIYIYIYIYTTMYIYIYIYILVVCRTNESRSDPFNGEDDGGCEHGPSVVSYIRMCVYIYI